MTDKHEFKAQELLDEVNDNLKEARNKLLEAERRLAFLEGQRALIIRMLTQAQRTTSEDVIT